MRRAVVWVVLAALALPALGCGDDDGGEPSSSDELNRMVAALEKLVESPTRSQFEMRGDTEEEGRFAMSGLMESVGQQSRLRARYEQDGETIPIDMVMHEDVAWMSSPSLRGLLPPGKRWIQSSDPELIGGSTLTPAQFGELLQEVGEVEHLGRERLRGTAARHLRAVVDMAAWARRADHPSADAFLRLLGGADASFPVDLWLAPDDSVLRFHVRVRLPRPGGGREQEVVLEMDELEYNVPVDTEPPPADQVTDDSVLQLSGP